MAKELVVVRENIEPTADSRCWPISLFLDMEGVVVVSFDGLDIGQITANG